MHVVPLSLYIYKIKWNSKSEDILTFFNQTLTGPPLRCISDFVEKCAVYRLLTYLQHNAAFVFVDPLVGLLVDLMRVIIK